MLLISVFYYFFLPAILILVVIAGVEIYLRVKYKHQLRIRVYPQVYVPDDDLGYRYRPDTQGEIRIPGIERRFRTNKQGFHSEDFKKERTPGIFRIAFIGTSNTTGIWMDGQGKNFSELLEDHLQAAGHRVEVMNFGIDGRFRAVHELRIIETDVALYNPDMVLMDVELPFVYGSFRRDVYRSYVMIYNPETEYSRLWCEAMINTVLERKFLIRVYYLSYIIRAATRWYINRYNDARSMFLRVFVENRIQAPDITLLPYSLKRSVEAVKEAEARLAKQGSELIIFQYSANLYYRQVSAKYEIPYLELDVPPIPQYVHDHDGHYRYEGHVEVARQLFDQLTARGIFNKNRKKKENVPRKAGKKRVSKSVRKVARKDGETVAT